MTLVNIIEKLNKGGLISPPKWLSDNTIYQVIMGSEAYAVSSGGSDIDIYGVVIPPKDLVFPHLAGEIPGFGNQIQRFEVFQQHHVKEANTEKEYDLSVYGIVKYFQLAMENNPNILDSLFVPRRCILHSTTSMEVVLQNKRVFLHKGSFHKLKGYAYSQLSKMKKDSSANEKRQSDIEKFGYSTKFAYHLIRLILQAEQILIEHDLNLERNKEILKSIRRGEWTMERIQDFFENKERSLEQIYLTSTLRERPDEGEIKKLLLDTLEQHYGSLSNAIKIDVNYEKLGRDIRELLERNGI